MNAIELAEYIQEAMPEAANMLRQQQKQLDQYEKSTDYWIKLCQEANAEIEALKAELKEWTDEADKNDAEQERNWNEAYGK